MMSRIPFNKPYLCGKELPYIEQAIRNGHLSGNGSFTKACHTFFQDRYGFGKCLLTSSCTDALEMAALLLNIKPGDEVIAPSFTFVSTVNAFVLRGAVVRFADSRADEPNLDVNLIEPLISEKTRAIIVVHYAGVACDMEQILALAQKYNLAIVEDAAHATDSYYKNRPLGSFGHLAAFSFHETKNIISGEGGMLVINDLSLAERAEIIWEKGTNRSSFFRGQVNKYEWVDIGSSFLPSEITAAFLFAQLENLDKIQAKRKEIWNHYMNGFRSLADDSSVRLPFVPHYASNNAHMFYLICDSALRRDQLILHLDNQNIHAVFHYQSLHQAAFYKLKHHGRTLRWSDYYSDGLVRLPFFFELSRDDQNHIINSVSAFFSR